MTAGICPFAVWRPTKNHGYGGRTGQNRPSIITSHIMGGYKSTMDGPWLDQSGISSHFGIGDDGSISQYVNILNASYANGITGYPSGKDRMDRTNRHIAAIEQEPTARWQQVNVSGLPYWNLVGDVGGGVIGSLYNCRSVSIEHEGVNQMTRWPEPKVLATIRVHAWIVEECDRLGTPLEVDADLLVGHFQLDPVHRAYCPGPEWPKARILEALMDEEDDMAITNSDGSPRQGWFPEGNRMVLYNSSIPVIFVGDEAGQYPGQIAKNYGGQLVYLRNEGQKDPDVGEAWWSLEPGD